MKKRTGW